MSFSISRSSPFFPLCRRRRRQCRRQCRRLGSGVFAAAATAAAASFALSLFVRDNLVNASSRSSFLSSTPPSLDEPFQTSFRHLPHASCVSLYHRFGRVGCGTLGRSTMTGRLLHWSAVAKDDDDDEGEGGSGANARIPPYVAVMDETEYTVEKVEKLLSFAALADEAHTPRDDPEGAGVLRGLLVLNLTATGSGSGGEGVYYSPAPQTPRGAGTPSEQLDVGPNHAWNTNGDGMTIRDMYGLPTAYIYDSDVASVLYASAKEQGDVVANMRASTKRQLLEEDDLYPAIVAEFNYYMGQEDLTSKDCLAWKDRDGTWSPKCLPLGGNSVWAAAGSPDIVDGGADGGGGRRNLEDKDAGDDGKRPVIFLATNLDSTSMFHDASPGANSAASNILALIMAAKLLGGNVPDSTLDGLPKRVAFAFFQAEMYGYVGSRAFLKDVSYPGFQCDDGAEVPAVFKNAASLNRKGCLYPLRTSLDFRDLGSIAGMIAVDQVGVLASDKTFYVHHGENAVGDGDDETAAFLSNVLLQLNSDDWTVSSSSVEADDDGAYPLPPTPLTSLVKLSGSAVGGAVLAGYDDAFANGARYQSHLDFNGTRPVNMNSIAAAATVLARAALAAAYDDGTGDYESAAQYASGLIPALAADDETLVSLAHCLLEDGNCDTLLAYGRVENTNTKQETGVDLGMGTPLGKPPSYYPSIYDLSNGQGFVQLGDSWYGAYTGDVKYGNANTDTFLIRPSLLEMSIHGLLNDFLGRGSSASESDEDMSEAKLKTCDGSDDCSDVTYCSSTGDRAVCTGGKVCVCSRANYHPAFDEALVAAPNNPTGFFLVRDGEDGGDDTDEGISAMYTEPFWSRQVGVGVYRNAGGKSGNWALGAGFIVATGCFASTWLMKQRLKKEKLY